MRISNALKKSAAALAVSAFVLTGCGGGSSSSGAGIERSTANFADSYNSSDTWTVYWYLCGSNLESDYGAASADIEELKSVNLPPNVKVLVETGGSNVWHTDGIPSNALARFLYDENGWTKLETLPDASMADPATVSDFLRFGEEHYPADHKVFVFWDHGGGSMLGVCLDDKYQNIMSLDQVRSAFTSVYGSNPDAPPFELVGFDACLMATIDTVESVYGISKYMAASEESEPACGWNYKGWVGALAQNPAMGGDALGKAICDTYMDGCAEIGEDDMATFSVIDVSKSPNLQSAYGAYGIEALRSAAQNPQRFFSQLSRDAESSENYGGNTRSQGYMNMVDLGDLAKNTSSTMPQTSASLKAAVNDAVLYKANGAYRTEGTGLSGCYSYDGDPSSWQSYASLDVSSMPINCLFYYLFYGEMPNEAQQYLSGDLSYTPPAASSGSQAPQPQITVPSTGGAQTMQNNIFNVAQLENTPVDIDNEGSAFVRLSPSAMDILTSVHCQFFYMSEADDIIVYLGSDANINADWDSGIFKDNFFGQWPMLDGHPVYVEITYEGDDYNVYSVPVKLNGVECNLVITYSFKDEKYHILGARRGIDPQYGVPDRNLIKLKAGDTITTIHFGMTMTGDDMDYTQVDVDTFTLGANPKFDDEDVGEGTYGYYFEFVDPLNNSAWSEMVTYTIAPNGEITTSVGGGAGGGGSNGGGFVDTSNSGGGIAAGLSGGGYSDGGYGSGGYNNNGGGYVDMGGGGYDNGANSSNEGGIAGQLLGN